MRILIVDDLVDNRRLYAMWFELDGFEVDEAGDGQEALARVDATPPDVIVMDLSMPKLDGWEATRLLKTSPKTRAIPILILTGIADAVELDRARAAGADAICTKPCLPTELAAARVEELLRSAAKTK